MASQPEGTIRREDTGIVFRQCASSRLLFIQYHHHISMHLWHIELQSIQFLQPIADHDHNFIILLKKYLCNICDKIFLYHFHFFQPSQQVWCSVVQRKHLRYIAFCHFEYIHISNDQICTTHSTLLPLSTYLKLDIRGVYELYDVLGTPETETNVLQYTSSRCVPQNSYLLGGMTSGGQYLSLLPTTCSYPVVHNHSIKE